MDDSCSGCVSESGTSTIPGNLAMSVAGDGEEDRIGHDKDEKRRGPCCP